MHRAGLLRALGWGAVLPLVFALVGLAYPACAAPLPPLSLSIDQPVRFANAGGTVAFFGTITNNTGTTLDAATDLFLNFGSFDPSALSFVQVLGVPDFSLPDGAPSPDVELFDALVDPSATLAGSPYLADVTVSDTVGDVSDAVTISISVVPEPRSFPLLLAALTLVILFAKRRTLARWFSRGFAPIAVLAAMLAAGSAQAAVTPVSLYAPAAATSVWSTDMTQVGVEFQIANNGAADAGHVVVKSVTVQGGSVSANSPSLPIVLGEIGSGESAPLDLVITAPTTNGTTRYLVTINGTYTYGPTTYGFSINRALFPNSAGPGPITPVSGTTVTVKPPYSGIVFPPLPTPPNFGPNAETPILVPIGPPQQVFPPTPTATPVMPGTTPGGSVIIPVNNQRGLGAGTPPDPNAAASTDGVVLSTYNTGISYSTNGGTTFTDVNLFNPIAGRTSFFPQSDGGLCCDQVVVFIPDPNRPLFVWLQQYWPQTACATKCGPPPATDATYKITQPNRLRVAWATPADIKANFNNAWTYADLTAVSTPGVGDGLGTKNNEWMDYPDLAWSGNFLYVGVDHGSTTPGSVYTGKRIVARLSLADMRNTAATVVHYDYAELSGSNGLNKDHFVQQVPNTMVVGSLDNSSTFRVFSWDDGSGSINNNTVAISQIQQGANYTSIAPDNTDWLAVSFPGNVTGAVYRQVIPGLGVPSQEQYIFAFDAGVNAPGRPRAYVRLETLNRSGSNFSALEEYDIWNPDYAFAMAALARDNELVLPEVGINLAVGGAAAGSSVAYPQMSIGFKDDFVVYQVTNSNATQVSRFGDYLSARWLPGFVAVPGGQSDSQFGAEAYDVILNPVPPGGTATCAAVGCVAKPRYIQFGRPPFTGPS
ncbi:MAG TPA: hypothetical protein VGF34_14485 [Stellaceae bacterium]